MGLGMEPEYGPSALTAVLPPGLLLHLVLGLDKLHNLTSGTPTQYEVRVDLQTANESAYAVYDSFQVASSKERYKLSVGKYRGTAGKSTHTPVVAVLV